MNWIEIDGDVVATDPSSGAIHVFHGAAAGVWQLLDGESIDDLADMIAETFGVPAEAASSDIELALSLLREADVLDEPTG